MLGVRLPEKLEKNLSTLADQTHASKSTFAIEALEEYLEDELFYQEALADYEDYLRSGKKTIPWEQIQKELGLLEDEEH